VNSQEREKTGPPRSAPKGEKKALAIRKETEIRPQYQAEARRREKRESSQPAQSRPITYSSGGGVIEKGTNRTTFSLILINEIGRTGRVIIKKDNADWVWNQTVQERFRTSKEEENNRGTRREGVRKKNGPAYIQKVPITPGRREG